MEYNFNDNLKNEWLSKCDDSIRDIADEFLNITKYISTDIFDDYLSKALKEMLDYYDINQIIYIQFFIPEDSFKKSNYWVIKKLINFINNDKYIITINSDITSFNSNYPIIIADDASYSGSQICINIEDYINLKNYKSHHIIKLIKWQYINLK